MLSARWSPTIAASLGGAMCAGRGARTSDGVGRAAPRHWYLIVLLTCAMAPLVACAPQSGARGGATPAPARQVNPLVPSHQAPPLPPNDDQGLAPTPPPPAPPPPPAFLINPTPPRSLA